MNSSVSDSGRELVARPRHPWVGWLALAVLLLLIIYPSSIMPWAPLPKARNLIVESDFWEFGKFLQENTPPGAVVVSDAYWLVSWYGKRTSVWFPQTVAMVDELNDRLLHVDAVFLTSAFITAGSQTDPIWLILFSKPRAFGEFTDIREFRSTNGYRVVLYQREAAAR